MPEPSRSKPPLTAADLDRLALRYVERFATTRARLSAYLARKLRERGWDGEGAPDPGGIAERMAERGYVDDRAFAEARVRSMARRGLGARRVAMALRHDGIDAEDSADLEEAIAADAFASALAFARRRRFGPFSAKPVDRDLHKKQVAAFLRAGHPPEIAFRILRMEPGEEPEAPFNAGHS
ncbi:regulatory protein RecX [Sphingomonas sp. R1]|uniref:regulatory protein RecX n=1 Tax=Sphingomonas sp. R1 TaxID=399176 RepID=UPI0022244460|nr:RecX family transcriptional regulator [Sphingomonas sp. R1]UYY78699.1 RecX family transcriptional regulator [Sphingomonas sp. R1]